MRIQKLKSEVKRNAECLVFEEIEIMVKGSALGSKDWQLIEV